MSGALHDIVLTWLREREWLVDEHHDDGASILEISPGDGDAPWPVFLQVDEAPGLCLISSVLPEVPAEQREAVALAMVRANNGLAAGRFDLDLDDGDARFVTSVDAGADPLPDANVLGRLLARALARNLDTVDSYLDALEAVASGTDPHEAIRRAEAAS